MCITFIWINDEVDNDDKYKLILVMNRDEIMVRKTEEANWGPNGVLCGRDMEPGKEGGTWLGVDRRGRVAFLTNIFTGSVDPEAEGRGFLVVDWLKDGALSATDYLERLASSDKKFSPFNLVLLEVDNEHGGKYVPHYYRKGSKMVGDQLPVCLAVTQNKVIGISNSPLDKPFNKTTRSGKIFAETIEKYMSSDDLIEKLFDVMTDRQRDDKPDQQMVKQKHPCSKLTDEQLKVLSSTFVNMGTKYGTRTQTVVLVDKDDTVVFAERTKKSIGDEGEPEWMETRWFNFKIEE